MTKKLEINFLFSGFDCRRCRNPRAPRSADSLEDNLEHGLRAAPKKEASGCQHARSSRRSHSQLKENHRPHGSRSFRFLRHSGLPIS